LRKCLAKLDTEGNTSVSPLVWIHDYQLMLAASTIRRVSAQCIIMYFIQLKQSRPGRAGHSSYRKKKLLRSVPIPVEPRPLSHLFSIGLTLKRANQQEKIRFYRF
jgi:hypothetical protein